MKYEELGEVYQGVIDEKANFLVAAFKASSVYGQTVKNNEAFFVAKYIKFCSYTYPIDKLKQIIIEGKHPMFANRKERDNAVRIKAMDIDNYYSMRAAGGFDNQPTRALS